MTRETHVAPLSDYLKSLVDKQRQERARSLKVAADSVLVGDDTVVDECLGNADTALQTSRRLLEAIGRYPDLEQQVTEIASVWLGQEGIQLPPGSRLVLLLRSETSIESSEGLDSVPEPEDFDPEASFGSLGELRSGYVPALDKGPEKDSRARRRLIRENLGNPAAFEYLGPKLDQGIEALGLTPATLRLLAGVINPPQIRELLARSADDLMGLKGFGSGKLRRLAIALERNGFFPTSQSTQ